MKTKFKDAEEKQKVNPKAHEAIIQQVSPLKSRAIIKSHNSELLDEISENYKAKGVRQWNFSTLPSRIEHMVKSGAGVTARDLERIVGTDDLLRINYLERGLFASKSVCRISVIDTDTNEGWRGTGFLISPSLILTNNHVLRNMKDALNAIAEFDVEADFNGNAKSSKRFRLVPDNGFITSEENKLDFSIVAIEQISEEGVPLSNYGFLRLDPDPNKVNALEYVTIIQHPNGGEKMIAIRENKVVKLGDATDSEKNTRLWYASDTAPGSSGAAVFNDSWQVVALHHSTVPPKPEDNGEYKANEGIRISSLLIESRKIFNSLPSQSKQAFSAIQEFIDDVTGVRPFPNTQVGRSVIAPERNGQTVITGVERSLTTHKNVHPVEFYHGRKGYNENFLGTHIPLPKLTTKAYEFGSPATLNDSNDIELKYTHFSIVHNAVRKIAFFTASNIDGAKWKNLNRSGDKWWYDARIPLELQIDDKMYANEPVNGIKGWFDRGHLVRRLDPVWGTQAEANQADLDTFHWTNCSPQYWGFNQGQELWQGLENYLLYNTDKENIKANIFTGPVFGRNDDEHRGILIPQYFWKIIVLIASDGKLYSSAYLVSQKKYATNIPFEVLPIDNFNNFQVTVNRIESLTGLQFADAIQNSDVRLNQNEDLVLRSLADIKVPRLK